MEAVDVGLVCRCSRQNRRIEDQTYSRSSSRQLQQHRHSGTEVHESVWMHRGPEDTGPHYIESRFPGTAVQDGDARALEEGGSEAGAARELEKDEAYTSCSMSTTPGAMSGPLGMAGSGLASHRACPGGRSQLFNVSVMVYLVLWYGTSTLTAQLTKAILNQFDFPVFVGEFQFWFNFVLGYATIAASRRAPFTRIKLWFPQSTFPQNSKFVLSRQMFKLFFPMGTLQFVGKLFSLAATSICPIATVSSIRALSPLFIVLGYRLHYRILFSLRTYLSLVPLLLGVIIIVISQSNSSAESSDQISIYSEQLDNSSNSILYTAADSIGSTGSASTAHDLNTLIAHNPEQDISILSTIINTIHNNQIQLHGIFYALLSTSVFAAGSIYTKNVITNNNVGKSKEKKEIVRLALFSSDSTATLTALDLEKNEISNHQEEDYLDRVKEPKIDKLTTLMYCSLYGLAYSIPALLIYELPTLFSSKLYPATLGNTPAAQTTPIPYYTLIPWKLLIVNGFSYFFQSLLAFHILGMLPTVTYSIANMMKRIVVISISIIARGRHLTILEWLGLFHVTAGLYVYEKWGAKQK